MKIARTHHWIIRLHCPKIPHYKPINLLCYCSACADLQTAFSRIPDDGKIGLRDGAEDATRPNPSTVPWWVARQLPDGNASNGSPRKIREPSSKWTMHRPAKCSPPRSESPSRITQLAQTRELASASSVGTTMGNGTILFDRSLRSQSRSRARSQNGGYSACTQTSHALDPALR